MGGLSPLAERAAFLLPGLSPVCPPPSPGSRQDARMGRDRSRRHGRRHPGLPAVGDQREPAPSGTDGAGAVEAAILRRQARQDDGTILCCPPMVTPQFCGVGSSLIRQNGRTKARTDCTSRIWAVVGRMVHFCRLRYLRAGLRGKGDVAGAYAVGVKVSWGVGGSDILFAGHGGKEPRGGFVTARGRIARREVGRPSTAPRLRAKVSHVGADGKVSPEAVVTARSGRLSGTESSRPRDSWSR